MQTIKRVNAFEFGELFDGTTMWPDAFLESGEPGQILGFRRDFYMKLKDNAVILAAFDDDKPVGWCGGRVTCSTYSRSLFLAQEAFYLLPEYRNGLLPGRLMKEFERLGKELGVDGVIWSAHPGSPFERTLARHYKVFSTLYFKDLREKEWVV